LVNGLVVPPGRGQYRGKQGFNQRFIAAPRRPLQGIDRLNGAVLHQERASENLRCADIAPVRLQDIRGEALCLIEALHPERKNRFFKRWIAGARPFGV
jgi:hypothetical protein